MSNNQKMPHTGLRFVEWWSRRKNDSALRLLAAGIVAASLAWALDGASAADPMFRVPVGERQLLLDDTGITRIEKLQRTMHRPDKRGAVIRPAPAQRGSLQIRHAPFWLSREQVFKVLVANTAGPTTILPWYTSADGLHWVPGPAPDKTFMSHHVVYDRQDPNPNRRYKAARPPEGLAVSADGMAWTKLNVPGIPSSDEANFSYHPRERLFLLTVKRGGPHGRAVAVATSNDFVEWNDFGVGFLADDLDQRLGRERIQHYLADPTRLLSLPAHPADYTVDVYNMGLFRYDGAVHWAAGHAPPPHRPPSRAGRLLVSLSAACVQSRLEDLEAVGRSSAVA